MKDVDCRARGLTSIPYQCMTLGKWQCFCALGFPSEKNEGSTSLKELIHLIT